MPKWSLCTKEMHYAWTFIVMNEVQQRKQTDFTATDMPTTKKIILQILQTDFTATDMPTTKKNNTSNITNFP